jgi:hypothetical protein
LHNEELYHLYASRYLWVDGRIMLQWICGGEEKCIQGLVRKPQGKRLLGRPRGGREGSIEVDLREM